MSCIDGKGPRSFCGKEDCAYHFEKSFASFQGMCCGASDANECEENGCHCDKKKVDCWDKDKNGDITPYMVSKGCNAKYNFTCPCGHSWKPSIGDILKKWCKPCSIKRTALKLMTKKYDFITRARQHEKHKNANYDYKNIPERLNQKQNYDIICSNHGPFPQTPSDHLSGKGCPKCGHEQTASKRRSSPEHILKQFTEKYTDLYGYDEVVKQLKKGVSNQRTPITPFCKKHNKFFPTTVADFLSSTYGCPTCAVEQVHNKQRYCLKDWIIKFKQVHEDKYSYDNIHEFLEGISDQDTYITIWCPTHGNFPCKISNHASGKGCKLCAYELNGDRCRHDRDYVIMLCLKTYDESQYDYTNMTYVNMNTNINVFCNKCNKEFPINPKNHINGYGCQRCNRFDRSSKPAREWLSMIHSAIKTLQTDGSTDGEFKPISGRRFTVDGYDSMTKTIYEFHGDYYHGNPSVYKSDVFNSLCSKTMGELYQKTQEKKKYCLELGYKYVEIWESDWIRFKNFIRKVQLQFRKRKSNPI